VLAEKLLRTGTLFSVLPPATIANLAAASQVKTLAAGELLFRAGAKHDSVVYLTHGRMALYRRNAARDITLLLGIVEAPSLFGDAECAAGVQWMCSVRAEEDSWCLLIPNQDFLATIDSHAELAARMYRDASVRHLLANHTAQTIALHDVETRLLRLLLDYAHRFGRRDGKSAIIEKPISRVALAAALGVTRKTITRTIQPLEERGTIGYDEEGQIAIHDLDALRAILPHDLFGLSSSLGEIVLPVTDRWLDEAEP
jgi:CRP-like cAMP-binding protein